MYDFNLTAAELSAFHADMMDMYADSMPTNEEMEEMAAYYGA